MTSSDRTILLAVVGTILTVLLAACGAPSPGPSAAGAATPATTPASVASPTAQVSVGGKNLIVNGDAEAAAGTDGYSVAANVPSWTRTGDFTAIAYDPANADDFPTPEDPGPSDRGKNFFGGGPRAERSGAVQAIDVSEMGSVIDGGRVSYTFSAWLGGYHGQDDQAQLTARFLGGDGAALATASLPVVLDSDRGGRTALLLKTTTGRVPAGTRRIEVDMEMTRKAGTSNDGYADDLSLVLNVS